MEKRASFEEIERWWSIDDLQHGNFALDAWHAAERAAQKRADELAAKESPRRRRR